MAVALQDGAPVDLLDAWNEVTGTRLDVDTGTFLVSPLMLIEQGPEVWSEVADVVRAADSVPALHVDTDEPGVTWLRPLDRLASLRDFLAFENHVKAGAERREAQVPDY